MSDNTDPFYDNGEGLAVAMVDNGEESSLLVEYESDGEIREVAFDFDTVKLRNASKRYLKIDEYE